MKCLHKNCTTRIQSSNGLLDRVCTKECCIRRQQCVSILFTTATDKHTNAWHMVYKQCLAITHGQKYFTYGPKNFTYDSTRALESLRGIQYIRLLRLSLQQNADTIQSASFVAQGLPSLVHVTAPLKLLTKQPLGHDVGSHDMSRARVNHQEPIRVMIVFRSTTHMRPKPMPLDKKVLSPVCETL